MMGDEERADRDVILLEGIEIPAALGVTAAERKMRRPVLIDLEVERDLRAAGRSDRIRDTVNYERIFQAIEEVATQREHRLVEALAERVAERLLSEFPIDAVTVSARKPKPIAGVLDHAGVCIRRTR
jgi:dihydroneopterin aldolase